MIAVFESVLHAMLFNSSPDEIHIPSYINYKIKHIVIIIIFKSTESHLLSLGDHRTQKGLGRSVSGVCQAARRYSKRSGTGNEWAKQYRFLA